MKKEENNLERLKGTNPFIVPEGYMEEFTERIMAQLPDKPQEEENVVSLMDHVRPWLYLAAMFVGLGLFFKAIVGIGGSEGNALPDSLLVRTEIPAPVIIDDEMSEDEEYLEYLEAKYTDYLMNEDFDESE